MLARPETLVDYLHHQLSWLRWTMPSGAWPIGHLQPRHNGYLKKPLEELLPP